MNITAESITDLKVIGYSGYYMIHRYKDALLVKIMPGLVRRTLAEGESMMICEFALEQGVEIPIHSHPHEQVGYVASGKVRITIDDQSYDLGPGDCYSALSGVPHGALVLERAVVVDTFSPPREDYKPTSIQGQQ